MSDSLSESGFDLDHVDRLLTTTRAVRKRLDLEREVSDELIFECIDLAEQAPTGGNRVALSGLINIWGLRPLPSTRARLRDFINFAGARDRIQGNFARS